MRRQAIISDNILKEVTSRLGSIARKDNSKHGSDGGTPRRKRVLTFAAVRSLAPVTDVNCVIAFLCVGVIGGILKRC